MESKHHLIHLWAKVEIPPHPHECFPFMFSWSFSCSCLRTHLGLKKKFNLCVTAFTRADLCASRWKNCQMMQPEVALRLLKPGWLCEGLFVFQVVTFSPSEQWNLRRWRLWPLGLCAAPLHPPSPIMSSLHCFIIICLFGLNCSQLKPPYTSCKELQVFQSFSKEKSGCESRFERCVTDAF